MPDVDKVGAIVIRDKKMLVCAKKGMNVLISLGGKRDGAESDEVCLHREVMEETGCKATNVGYYDTFKSPTVTNDGEIIMRCYFCNLVGEPVINPKDNIYAFEWIGHDYKEKGFKIAPLMEKFLVPALIRDGYL